MKKTVSFLRSEAFIFITLVFVLSTQIIHTMYLFESVRVFDLSFTYGEWKITAINWTHAFTFAVAIEAAILMFILNGKSMPSKIYAIASFATNVLYYKAWTLTIPELSTTVLISAMLAGSIWFFSDLFAEKIDVPRLKAEEELNKILHSGEEKISFKTTLPANGR